MEGVVDERLAEEAPLLALVVLLAFLVAFALLLHAFPLLRRPAGHIQSPAEAAKGTLRVTAPRGGDAGRLTRAATPRLTDAMLTKQIDMARVETLTRQLNALRSRAPAGGGVF